jgi:hypothetical protein
MSAINFFEQFAALDINKDVTNEKQNIKNQQKNVKIEKQEKKNKFIHGKNVIMITGQYKGYCGFVYEYFQEKMNVAVDDFTYVLANVYGDRKVGDKIKTQFGESVIISKIDAMYKVLMKSKTESGVETKTEVVLSKSCFIRLVSFTEGGIKKFGQFMKSENGIYDLVMLNLDYKRNYDDEDILKIISDVLVTGSGKYKELYGELIKRRVFDCNMEYYMVCESPKNKNDVNYFAKYGMLSCEIPEQYFVVYKRIVKVNKNVVDIDGNDGDNINFKSGVYKDKQGKLMNIESASLNVQIDAIGKMITDHLVKTESGFSLRKIVPKDVFYCDIELEKGIYFQVDNCYDDRFVGIKRTVSGMENATILRNEITESKFMSGFTIYESIQVKQDEQDEQEIDVKNMFIDDTDDTKEETDDVDEKDIDDYGELSEQIENKYENMEGEMKETFRDTERTSFVQRTFSKDEKEYMKMIEKCVSIIGEVSNVYTILDYVNNAVKVIKKELAKISVFDWKNTDVKYIVACFVTYDLIRNDYSVSIYDFKKNVVKLFDVGYFTKNTISNSLFIRSDKDIKKSSCLSSIQMSNDQKSSIKKLYKESKYVEIIKVIIENCNIILQECFEKVVFTDDKSKIDFIPLSKPNTVREYPKYFLTTQDIIDNSNVSTARKILWGPKSQRLVNIWKESLNKKLEKESNVVLKSVYTFVIDNLENAPFVLPTLEKSEDKVDKLKYRELKRSFDIFSDKLKIYVTKMNNEKQKDLEMIALDKDRLNKRRMEISNNRGDSDELELVDSVKRVCIN